MRSGSCGRGAVALLGVLALSLAIGPTAAFAQDEQVKLALVAVDQPGPYFDVTMQPGERRTFTVELGVASSVAVAARTYAADAYTIINGGFGGRRGEEPRTAMTTWLDYPAALIELEPGPRIRRSFSVTVPADAVPGEYITSLFLERDIPASGDGSLLLAQVSRQATAVVVVLPGARTPELTIGSATHREVAGLSIISVAVANPGNIRLKPTVTFALFDAQGAQVSQATIQMDSFYAWTDTFIEVPLAARLLPGAYTVRLSLRDGASGAAAEDPAIPLTVEGATYATGADGTGAQFTPVDQGPGSSGGGFVSVLLALIGGGLLVLVVGGVVVRRRSRQARTDLGR